MAAGIPDGVLAVDETSFLKKNLHLAGARVPENSGTAGRIEICPVGGFLDDVSQYGRALTGRRHQSLPNPHG